jgi:hypothetical protein
MPCAMDRADTEMMETETSDKQQELDSNTDQNDVVRDLLTLARQFIDQGKPSQALQAVTFPNILFLFLLIFLSVIDISKTF